MRTLRDPIRPPRRRYMPSLLPGYVGAVLRLRLRAVQHAPRRVTGDTKTHAPTTAEQKAHAVAEQQHRLTPDRLRAHIDPNFIRYPHVRLICEQVQLAVLDPKIRVVIVKTQRQIGKSWAAKAILLWFLEWYPGIQMGVVSYSSDVATRIGRDVRNLIDNNRHKLATRLAPDSQRKDLFHTEEGGGLVCAGVGGSITSTTMNIALFDDVHKSWIEAQSPAARQKVWTTFEVDVQGAMSDYVYTDADGARRRVPQTAIAIGTGYHVEDFLVQIAEYYEPDEVFTIHIPALADPNVVDPDPLGRKPGEPACPERFSREEMEARRDRLDPVIWSTQYQGVPVGVTGGTIDGDLWQWADRAPLIDEREITVSSWDLTFGATGKSWCVGQLWCAVASRKHPGLYDYHLLDQVRRQLEFDDQVTMMHWMCKTWGDKQRCKLHLLEMKANGAAMLSVLRKPHVDSRGKRWPPMSNIVEINPVDSKLVRAEIAKPGVKRSFLPSWWEPSGPRWPKDTGDDPQHMFPHTLIVEGRHVGQGGKTDDEIDVATQAITWFDENIVGRSGGRLEAVDASGGDWMRR